MNGGPRGLTPASLQRFDLENEKMKLICFFRFSHSSALDSTQWETGGTPIGFYRYELNIKSLTFLPAYRLKNSVPALS